MPFPYYKKDGERHSKLPKKLTLPLLSQKEKAETYRPGNDLADAVNVAMLLGQPLLLTGNPGTGKTQLAYSVNWQLGFVNPEPFSFETKSTSAARDLFYNYDAIGRFHAAQNAQIEYQRLKALNENESPANKTKPEDLPKDSPAAYINYNALGLAILLANKWETARRFLPFYDEKISTEKHLEKVKELKQFKFLEKTTVDTWQRRSVVLIDEVDKAPRDFPNDILNEIEKMFFRVPELNDEIYVTDEEYRPVVIITSNSERNLPDAFLRRCAYYHIEPPNLTQLREIVVRRLFPELSPESSGSKDWLDEALGLFEKIRKLNLFKTPATAELLGWITAIQSKAINAKGKNFQELKGGEKSQFVNATLTLLLKTENDRKKVSGLEEMKLAEESEK
ncbi:MAG TPA: MoxR family ATPase [Pyrinomonadaceae bacterium]|jgi:MoxR-like ATPase